MHKIIGLLIIGSILLGCSYSVYSTGYPHLKTITIQQFQNSTTEYQLENELFLDLSDKFEQDGRLSIVTLSPDCQLEGSILDYSDKIYIGRDFIDLLQFKRKYFGIKELIKSLQDQNEVLLDKAEQKLRKPVKYKSFFQEINEYVNELQSESFLILQSLPPHIDFSKLKAEDLIDINAQYRTINHFLIELRDEVAEFENLLFKNEMSFVRYVTKYKKDLANLISYFNIRINGCLSE